MDQAMEKMKNLQVDVSCSSEDGNASVPPVPEVPESATQPFGLENPSGKSADEDDPTQPLRHPAQGTDEETPKKSQLCFVCKSPAKNCCKACQNVDILNKPGQAARDRTFYCGKECQTSDWPKHKDVCKTVRSLIDDKMLERAAIFLQEAFYAYRKCAFDLSIKKIKVKKDTVIFTEGKYDTAKALVDFPEDLVKGEKPFVRNMLYTLLACTDQLRSIWGLCNALIEETGIAKEIDEVNYRPKRGPLQWKFHRNSGKTETPEDYMHSAYRIETRSGSTYALDLAGAQFGHEICLQPWTQYEGERIESFCSIEPFGTSFGRERVLLMSASSVGITNDGKIKKLDVDGWDKPMRLVLLGLADCFSGSFTSCLEQAGWDIKKLLECSDHKLFESTMLKALVRSLVILHAHKTERKW